MICDVKKVIGVIWVFVLVFVLFYIVVLELNKDNERCIEIFYVKGFKVGVYIILIFFF